MLCFFEILHFLTFCQKNQCIRNQQRNFKHLISLQKIEHEFIKLFKLIIPVKQILNLAKQCLEPFQFIEHLYQAFLNNISGIFYFKVLKFPKKIEANRYSSLESLNILTYFVYWMLIMVNLGLKQLFWWQGSKALLNQVYNNIKKSLKMMEKYKMIENIGSGMFGTVDLVQDVDGKKFALKTVRVNPMEPERAQIQLEATKTITHPNIAKVYEVEFDGDQVRLVMEYCEGQNLTSFFHASHPKKKQTSILQIFSQIVDAGMTFADKGVIHRDIKPDNIMVGEIGGKSCIKIVDFGEAKRIPSQQDSYLIDESFERGTAIYSSPEMLNNCPYNSKADVWAAGCVLYEMAFNAHPFKCNTISETVEKIKQLTENGAIQTPFPTDLRIKKLLSMSLQYDPKERATWRQIKLCRALDPQISNPQQFVEYMKKLISISDYLGKEFWKVRKQLDISKKIYKMFSYYVLKFQVKLKENLVGMLKNNAQFEYLFQKKLDGIQENDLRSANESFLSLRAEVYKIEQKMKGIDDGLNLESKIPHKRDSTFACLDCSIRAAKIIVEEVMKKSKMPLSPQVQKVIKFMMNWVHFQDNLSFEDKPNLDKFKKGQLSTGAKKWASDEFKTLC